MAVDPSVVINIATQFTGKKAFKQADTATQKLTKNVKNLASSFGIAFGTAAVVQFGKAAVKAFSEDEKSAVRLTRAVTNLGISFANPGITKFIAEMERSSAIADDVLRPSFQSLLTTTGSLTKSQTLLNDAITISRGSGIDLATVTDDLSRAYTGQTKGLVKYNTGLSKAELGSKSFADILAVLLKQSAGAAQDYLGTTAFKMDSLSIATGNAAEILGGGLVDAFAVIAGGKEATDAAKAIEGIAKAFNKVTLGVGTAIGGATNFFTTLKNLPKNIFGGFAGSALGVTPVTPKTTKAITSKEKQAKLLADLEKASIKRNKELAALITVQAKKAQDALKAKKDQAALDKAGLALLKGADVFDMDKISVQAALLAKGQELNKLGATGSETQRLQIANDLVRLTIKQDMFALEDAIAAKDVAGSTALADKLNKDLLILGTLQGQNVKLLEINSILKSFKPVDLINLQNLKDALALLAAITGTQVSPKASSPTIPNIPKSSYVPPSAATVLDILGQSSNVRMPSPEDRAAILGQADIYTPPNAAQRGGIFGTTPTPNITISAGVIASPDEFAAIVQKAVQNANRFGNNLDFAGAIR